MSTPAPLTQPATTTRSVTLPPPRGDAVWRPRLRPQRFPLTTQELEAFRYQGFVVVRNVFSRQEAAALVAECAALQDSVEQSDPSNLRCDWEFDPINRRHFPSKIEPVVDISRAFSALASDPRLLDRLATIYDGQEPRLFKDKVITKPGRGKGSALHQDWNSWQGFPISLVSVAVALDATNAQNGCTEFHPWNSGFAHVAGQLQGMDERLLTEEAWVKPNLEPGDIVFFNCFVPHRAADNATDDPRRLVILTFNDQRDGEWYQAHREMLLGTKLSRMNETDLNKAYFR